ncbi:prolipoprotein diacylglyceryl transferase [Paenibacillus albiflavus]|uniref:Phosphatidylglycerol--prolipoprotein diacylglyceryl transferase n=1 Tax=Paenibacillus albiflavus TaxID=2545760 RepID=A0A4R4EQH4_9BACL|nr:prolipoprotein diacylglyceryl transferase [Paenibacillus albiflavus]TCZ80841.1 prolipoprotein diacylglyceryl transferase [Paenibacillus albiflavus]
MYNDIFAIGPVEIHGYGLMIAIGVFCALWVAAKRAKNNLDVNVVYDLTFIVLIFGFIGAKLLYILVEIETMIKDPMQILSGSGFVVYGGILSGLLAAILYCKKKKISFLKYFDLLIPSVAIAQGFGRIGCFLAGCCYGSETDSFIGIAFEHSEIAPNGVKLIPTQLFSSAGDFLIAFILIMYAKKGRSDGKVGALYLILYSIGRFIIEFYRDDYRGFIGYLSTSQFISVITLIIGIVMFFKLTKRWINHEFENRLHR